MAYKNNNRKLENDTSKINADYSRARDIAYRYNPYTEQYDASFPPADTIDWERRNKAESDLRYFLETYFPDAFPLDWSPDHLAAIAQMEKAILHGGLFALAFPRGTGKALDVATPLPTLDGWTTMGTVKVGDVLFDDQGRQCKVTYATEYQYDHKCYEVVFSDGERIVCDADHIWSVKDRYSDKPRLELTTDYMVGRVRLPTNREQNEFRYSIPMAKPLLSNYQPLPIDPFVLGCWLGDGTSSCANLTCSCDDREMLHNIERAGCTTEYKRTKEGSKAETWLLGRGSLHTRLRQMEVLNDKHIPSVYLRASAEQRLSLLQGLMDTDGTCNDGGNSEITVKSKKLADGICELCSSLGIKYSLRDRYVECNGHACGPYYRIIFTELDTQPIFRLSRKRQRQPRKKRTTLCKTRTIVDIREVASRPVRCIQVDSPSHLYLCGRRMVPTHNTTLTIRAAVWAILYGHRQFVVLVGATQTAAENLLKHIQFELSFNQRLIQDFPCACYPIVRLEGNSKRCIGQTYLGDRTQITWTADKLVLPTIDRPDSKCSGSLITCCGLTGNIRGQIHTSPTGEPIRPSFVMLDDPSTRESSASAAQTQSRIATIMGDVLGLAGPTTAISAVLCCTVIYRGDLADTLLDKDKHPQWNGIKTKTLYSLPTNDKLWDEYRTIREESFRKGGNGEEATEFYRKHQQEMDAGAKPAWDCRYKDGEISAIQSAMNLLFLDSIAFHAEYQNEPDYTAGAELELLAPNKVAERVNRYKRGVIPLGCRYVTAAIDCQQELLYYTIYAFQQDFTGYLIDCGTFPDQKRNYFTSKQCKYTLQSILPGAGIEGQLYAGLTQLVDYLMSIGLAEDNGTRRYIDRLLIDSGWQTETVAKYCRESQYARTVMPSKGVGIGAVKKPFSEYRHVKGDILGHHFRIPASVKRNIRTIHVDTNYWKSFIHQCLGMAVGDKGALTLWGDNPAVHSLYADHIANSEQCVRVSAYDRTVDEWREKAGRPDNHWLDTTVYAYAAASLCGCSYLQRNLPPAKRTTSEQKFTVSKKKKVTYLDW